MVAELSSIENNAVQKTTGMSDTDSNNSVNKEGVIVFEGNTDSSGYSSVDTLEVAGENNQDEQYAQTVKNIQEMEAKERNLAEIETQLNTQKQGNSIATKTAIVGGLLGLGVRSGLKRLAFKHHRGSNFYYHRFNRSGLFSKFIKKAVFEPCCSGIRPKNVISAAVFTLVGAAGGLLAGKALTEE